MATIIFYRKSVGKFVLWKSNKQCEVVVFNGSNYFINQFKQPF